PVRADPTLKVLLPADAQNLATASDQLDPLSKAASDSHTLLGERYRVIDTLGSGGMGTVYKVHDQQLNKEFAVKLLRSDLAKDEVSIKRFTNEIEAASQLTHVNLVGLYTHGVSTDGSPYFLMDCIDGVSLADILKKERKLSSQRALGIF